MREEGGAITAKIEALGGIFLASEDVPRLVAWYRALGVPLGEDGHCVLGAPDGESSPMTGGVFSIMPAQRALPPQETEVSEEPYGRRRVTMNLRVTGLDAVIHGLKSQGASVAGPRDYGYGRFAWTSDPDGNLVEIWEPASAT